MKEAKRLLMVNKRIIYQGAIYHITQRAPGRELLFLERGDYLYFLKLLKETAQKFHLEVFAFALMPNHVHLLLRIAQENLSESMKNLFERYAIYFNNKYERKGHVFCGRYRASLCSDENYFLAISLYIHLNPVYAGLSSSLTSYPWTSVGLYTTGDLKKSFIDYKEILSIIEPDIGKAKKIYGEMLKHGVQKKGQTLLEESSIRKNLGDIVSLIKRVGKNEKERDDLDALIAKFQVKRRVGADSDSKARKYLIEQLAANGYSTKEIAGLLKVNKSTVYRALNS